MARIAKKLSRRRRSLRGGYVIHTRERSAKSLNTASSANTRRKRRGRKH